MINIFYFVSSLKAEMRWLLLDRSDFGSKAYIVSREGAVGVISANCKWTVTPLGALAIMAETMFTSISCHGDLWLHFAVMEN